MCVGVVWEEASSCLNQVEIKRSSSYKTFSFLDNSVS